MQQDIVPPTTLDFMIDNLTPEDIEKDPQYYRNLYNKLGDKIKTYETLTSSRLNIKINHHRAIARIRNIYTTYAQTIENMAKKANTSIPIFDSKLICYKTDGDYTNYHDEKNELYIRWKIDGTKENIFISFQKEILKDII